MKFIKEDEVSTGDIITYIQAPASEAYITLDGQIIEQMQLMGCLWYPRDALVGALNLLEPE